MFVIKGKLVNNKIILTDKFKVSYYEELYYKNKPEGGDCKKVKSELEIHIVVWQFRANTHTSTQKSIKNHTTTPDVNFWTCIKPVI